MSLHCWRSLNIQDTPVQPSLRLALEIRLQLLRLRDVDEALLQIARDEQLSRVRARAHENPAQLIQRFPSTVALAACKRSAFTNQLGSVLFYAMR